MDNQITKLPKFSAERFTFELWASDFWNMLGLSYADAMEIDTLVQAVKTYAIGYCDSPRLKMRPKDEEYVAVMCEREGEKFWFHVFKDDIADILGDEDETLA